jgi:hypothetical protein
MRGVPRMSERRSQQMRIVKGPSRIVEGILHDIGLCRSFQVELVEGTIPTENSQEKSECQTSPAREQPYEKEEPAVSKILLDSYISLLIVKLLAIAI